MNIEIKKDKDFSFTGYEENFLQILQTHKLFEQFVLEIREVLGISRNIKAGQAKTILDERKREALKNLAVLLVGIYEKLPEEWYEVFTSIILTGTATPKTSNAISFSLDDNFYEPEEKELKITIRKNTEFQQVVEFITRHKQEIDKLLAELPTEHNTKMSYINIIQELVELKKEHLHKKHKEIVELYEENHTFPLPTTLVDYNSFNTYYDRYKKMRTRLLRTNPQGIEILKSTSFNIKGKI
jgi:hypothetical protein